MIRIYNKHTNETVAEIETNQSMTMEEMLEIAGAERIEADDDERGDYLLNGKEVYVEELDSQPIMMHESDDPATRTHGLRKVTGMSQQKFGKKYGIPLRTLQSWESGEREAPSYVLNMLERIVFEDLDDIGLKWCVVDCKDGDEFLTVCENRDAAIEEAQSQWDRLTKAEKEKRDYFLAALLHVNKDGSYCEDDPAAADERAEVVWK